MLTKVEKYEINDVISQIRNISKNQNISGLILTEAQKLDSVDKPYLSTCSVHKDNSLDTRSLFSIVNTWNKNSGWNYKNSFFIKPRDVLTIKGEEYTVSGFIYDAILYNKLILCDSKDNLHSIDLKKIENCNFLLNEIKNDKKPFYPDTKETLSKWIVRNLEIKKITDIDPEIYIKIEYKLIHLFKNQIDINLDKSKNLEDNVSTIYNMHKDQVEQNPEKKIKNSLVIV